MALDCCPWVLIVLRLARASLGVMLFEIYKSQLVGPWRAGARSYAPLGLSCLYVVCLCVLLRAQPLILLGLLRLYVLHLPVGALCMRGRARARPTRTVLVQ